MPRLTTTLVPLSILAVAGIGLASAQTSSPFASKKKRQAWEVPAPQTAPLPAAPTQTVPAPTLPRQVAPSQTYGTPAYTTPSYQAPSYDLPIQTTQPAQPSSAYNPSSNYEYGGGSSTPPLGNPTGGNSTAPQSYGAVDYGQPSTAPRYQNPVQQNPVPQQNAPQYSAPQYQAPAATASSTQGHYPGRSSVPQGYPAQSPASSVPPGEPSQYGQPTRTAQAPYPPQGGQPFPAPQQPRSWKEKLGLDHITTLFSGKAKAGAAASYRDVAPNQIGAEDGFGEDFIFDAELEFEASAITQGGLEYGIHLGARGQYDPYRRGFGGRTPLCPPDIVGCSASDTNSLRGHTSQFYQFGEDDARDVQISLESAHLFLRSAYGDVTIGRDDGAAYLFSLGAPTLLAVNASNSPVDYTGLDSVKTINDASGFSEKITYTSPRLLGDTVGVGVQLGVSYALDADVCGVDFCSDRDITRVIAPELEDVFEFGLALDRKFDNGLSVEGTVTYVTASEVSGAEGLDDLESYGAGLEFEFADWTLGGSYLHSNNGLLDGDYDAYDIGLTWKPSALGFSLAYGHAEDENVGLVSDQGTFGITYDFERFTLGTGVQYVDRSVAGLIADGGTFISGDLDQKATSVFVEAAVKF